MENIHSSGGARHLSSYFTSGYDKTIVFVAMVMALAVVQVACTPLVPDTELVAGLPSPALSVDHVARSGENTTQNPGSDVNDQEKVCVRLRMLRLLLRLAILKQVGDSPQEGATNTTTGSSRDVGASGNADSLTDEEKAELCRELCALNVCPPGCPGNYEPPWGTG